MNKNYNKFTTSDIPMESSFNSNSSKVENQKNSKQKINAIGKKANDKLNTKKPKLQTYSRRGYNKYAEGLQNLDQLSEESLYKYQFKSKRNKVIITVLVVLLLIAVSSVAAYTAITKLRTNCFMHVSGARATYILNDKEISKFRAPSGVEGKRILTVEIKLRIRERGNFRIKFTQKCYMNNELLKNVLIYGCNYDLFYEGGDGYWYSNDIIQGNQTILMCRGIILDDLYEGKLNVDNFTFDFYTYLEKV